jgi:hypothetical protein
MCTNFFREWAPRRLHALAAKLNEVCYLVGDGFKLPVSATPSSQHNSTCLSPPISALVAPIARSPRTATLNSAF